MNVANIKTHAEQMASFSEESRDLRFVFEDPSSDDIDVGEDGDALEEDEESPESSVAQDGETQLVQSRKRKAQRIPRIYKNDLRRLYSTMLANVLNDSDYGKFSSFFNTFCTNTMMVKIKGVGQTLVPKHITYFPEAGKSRDITFYGVDWVRFHFFSMFRMVSDQIFDIKNAKIVLKRNAKRSAVVMDTQISFSQLYDTTPFAFVDAMFCDPHESENAQHHGYADASPLTDALSQRRPTRPLATLETFAPVSSRNTLAQLPSVEEKTDIPDPAALYPSITGRPLPLFAHPQPVSFPSRLMIFLNENKFIETIVLGTDDSVAIPFSDLGVSTFGSNSTATLSSGFDDDDFD